MRADDWKIARDEDAFPELLYASPALERIKARAYIDGTIGRLRAGNANQANDQALRQWWASLADDLQLGLALLDRLRVFEPVSRPEDLLSRGSAVAVVQSAIDRLGTLRPSEKTLVQAYLQGVRRDLGLLPSNSEDHPLV